LRLQVLYEKKQYNKLLCQKYRRFRAKLFNNRFAKFFLFFFCLPQLFLGLNLVHNAAFFNIPEKFSTILFKSSDWSSTDILVSKDFCSKKQYNKLLRQKYRRFRAKLFNNMLEVFEKTQQNFGKFMII
jgi:hypothetical protein